MKRLLVYITAAMLCAAGAEAQNMEKLFAEMPDSIVPVMSKTNRLDCIDFFKSKMTGNVQNIFNGRSSISDLDENYLLLKPTSRSQVEMRLYSAGAETKIIAVAYTYMAPARETALAFYTTKWEKLNTADFISLPQKKDFIKEDGAYDAEKLEKARGILSDAFVFATIGKESGDISFALSTDALTETDLKQASPYMAQPPKYAWNGKKFARQ